MVVRFTTICAISAYRHLSCEFEPCSWQVTCDRSVVFSGYRNIVESGVKHHKPNQNIIKKKQIWRYYKGYWNCKSLTFYDGQTTHWMAKNKKDKKINNDPSNIAQKRTDWTIRTSQKPVMLYRIHLTISKIQTQDVSVDRHWLHR